MDKIPVIPLCDIKLMMNGKDTHDMSVDSPCPKYSDTLMAINGNIPIDSIVSRFEKNPRKCKQKLSMKKESSDEDENSPVKKRNVRVVSKRNRLIKSDDSSSEEEYNPSKKKVVRVTSGKDKTSKYKMESESESEQSSDEKTPYEKMIERRRAEHKALLQELKLNEMKAGLLEAVGDFKQKTKPVMKIRSYNRDARKSQVFEPTRRSKRLANVAPDLSEDGLYQKALREATEEKQEERNTPIASDLSFKEALHREGNYEECIKHIFCQEAKSDQKFYEYDKPALRGLTLKDGCIAKLTPARISAASWCPVEKLIVAAGDKYGNYGIWNVESESDPYLFRIHRAGITSMKFSPYNHAQIISTSYDGTVRCCDVVKHMFSQVYDMFGEAECTYFDFLSETTCIVSQTNGQVVLVDKRSSKKSSEKKHKCHQSVIKTVDVHPVNKNVFVTASRGREIHLWDLRKLQKEPIFGISHHTKSVSSAFFSPVTGSSLLTTSLDDTLCIFDTTNLTSPIKLKIRAKHNNTTGRWLSIFRASWLPYSDDSFVVGSMSYPRKVEVFNSNMNICHELQDENLNSITSINAFHPFRPAFMGCNSSGKTYVFT